MVSLLYSLTHSLLVCHNNFLSRGSTPPDFSVENPISSNHAVAADFSLRSTAIQNSNPPFLLPVSVNGGRRGYWENPKKKEVKNMKNMKLGILIVIINLVIAISVIPAGAVSFTGTPTPSLSPVFGTLVDFDDQATGTLVGEFDYVGVGVSSVKELEGLGTFARYSGTQSFPNYIGTGFGGERGTDANMGWDGTIRFKFTNAADAVGIGIADSQGGPEILTVYDASMNVLESVIAPTGLNTYAGFTRSSFDIAYFDIKGDFFAIDDLQFNSTKAVPEPSTLLLLSSGLLGIGFFARKRMKG